MEEQNPNPEPSIRLEEDAPPPKPPGFWKRQYDGNITTRQKIFDVLFGTVIPIVLLVFDPIVFRGGACLGVNARVAAFVYFGVGLGVIALGVWLAARPRLGRWIALLAGGLLAGALFALIIGIVMLPLSILGLFVCIGALGFIPFITAFVYHRNGVRAHRMAKSIPLARSELAGLMLAGVVISIGFPVAIQARVTTVAIRATQVIAEGASQAEVAAAVQDLRTLNTVCLGLCTPNIGAMMMRGGNVNPEARQRLELAYGQITGNPDGWLCGTLDNLIAPRSSAE